MEKNTYQTYEFLPTENSEPNADQFFVVEEDGTFLINRQVQYVAQVQDVKEVLEDAQPCAMYDVSSQQFYVDVDNSSELISVSDQFILPEGENTIYNNSYLLQPAPSTNVEQVEEDVVMEQFKQIQTTNVAPGNNLTEITITDEQYRTLEQKGWILLELNDKIFVLNTLGLHDITSNDKLVQKLRSESQVANPQTEPSSGLDVVLEQTPNVVDTNTVSQDCQQQLEVKENHKSIVQNGQFVIDENFMANIQKDSVPITLLKEMKPEPAAKPIKKERRSTNVKIAPRKERKCLKIKTKMNFKDIPDKVFLGHTVTGKRLVARVVKRRNINQKQTEKSKYQEVYVVNGSHNTGIFESEFVNLVQQSVRGRIDHQCSPADIESAKNVITHLRKLPHMTDTFQGEDIIVTKVGYTKDSKGVVLTSNRIIFITGRVVTVGDTEEFHYIPDLLHNITDKLAAEECKDSLSVIHIHVTETTWPDNFVRASVIFNKRELPLDLISDPKRRYPSSIFACSACAATFNSEELLTNHQQSECLGSKEVQSDVNEPNQLNEPIAILQEDNKKMFSCSICNAIFSKQSNCKRHMRSHNAPIEVTSPTGNDNREDTMKSAQAFYKCNMCSSVYFHPSTLSKHIVSKHINIPKKL